MGGGDLRGFGGAWVDDDDLGVAFVAGETLVEDGVSDGEVGPYQDDDVGEFEVCVGVRWGIEAEGLLVCDDGGGHALAGVTVAVLDAHAEFGEGAEKGHFFGCDLAGGDEGDGFGAVRILDFFKAVGEGLRCFRPGDFGLRRVGVFAVEWSGGALGRVEDGEGFPAFGAGHAEIDGVFGGGGDAGGLAFELVEVELATGRAESTD